MKIGVLKETLEGETRVALIPETIRRLTRTGSEVLVETGAGDAASFSDAEYEAAGAVMLAAAADVAAQAELLVKVQPLSIGEVEFLREGQVVASLLIPTLEPNLVLALVAKKITMLSLNLLPRITRAQSMDVLSSMSTVAGYKAVLMASARLGKFLPMLMTAAGTIAPSRVFVLGAGVAGLQAIATAKRLGAIVEAFDTRPAVKEQVESLGANFVEVELDTSEGEDAGGYAKEHSEEFLQKEQTLIGERLKQSDIVITTALIPGKPAPTLITADMVKAMRPGSVIIDLAAEMGGNCELTEPGQEVIREGVVIVGHLNLPATVPVHASQMFSNNIRTLLLHLMKDKVLQLDMEDAITGAMCVTHAGAIVHQETRDALQSGAQR